MQTITIELLNEQTFDLIRQLEQLKLLRLISPTTEQEVPPVSKRTWVGVLSQETGRKMLEYTEKSRDEWERNT